MWVGFRRVFGGSAEKGGGARGTRHVLFCGWGTRAGTSTQTDTGLNLIREGGTVRQAYMHGGVYPERVFCAGVCMSAALPLLQVLFWDTSAGNRPVASIKAAHGPGPDVHCVDWSGLQEHLVVTGDD